MSGSTFGRRKVFAFLEVPLPLHFESHEEQAKCTSILNLPLVLFLWYILYLYRTPRASLVETKKGWFFIHSLRENLRKAGAQTTVKGPVLANINRLVALTVQQITQMLRERGLEYCQPGDRPEQRGKWRWARGKVARWCNTPRGG